MKVKCSMFIVAKSNKFFVFQLHIYMQVHVQKLGFGTPQELMYLVGPISLPYHAVCLQWEKMKI